MQNDVHDVLAQIDAVSARNEATDYVTPEGDTVTPEAVGAAALNPLRYDPVLGMVPADLDESGAEVWVAEEAGDDPDRDVRDDIIEDQMSTPEAREGQANWERQLEQRRREQAAKDEALDHMAAIRAYIGSKLIFQPDVRDAYLDVLTVWSLHCCSFRAAGITPYLNVCAPTMGSGKSQLLKVLYTLVPNPSPLVSPADVTGPALALVAEEGMVLLLDECDKISKGQMNQISGLLNTGYAAGGTKLSVGRAAGGKFLAKTTSFCPKIVCGISRSGSLPLPEDTLSRSIEIRMVAATPVEKQSIGKFNFTAYRDAPEIVAMRDFMSDWSRANWTAIRDTMTEVPVLSTSRAMEIWEVLITLGDLLSPAWGARIRAAAVQLDSQREHAIDPNAALIQDVRVVLTDWTAANPGSKAIPVEVLVTLRNGLADRKVTESLSTVHFGRRMSSFGIRSVPINRVRNYRVLDEAGSLLPTWTDVFLRYSE